MNSRILTVALALAAMLATAAMAQDPAATPAVVEAAPAAAPAVVEPAPAETAVAAPAAPAAPDAKALLAEVAAAKPGDPKAGADKAAACAACHGLDGNSSDPQYPKIAGQHELYIARQLARFKTGVRANAIMLGFATTLSAQDMRDVGAYFASQRVVPGLADEAPISAEHSPYKGRRVVDVGGAIFHGGNRDAGVPACMACHGPTGVGNPGPSYPALSGQHAGYIGSVLAAYKAVPVGDPMLGDANYAIMATIAKRMSDEEILAVASYVEGLHARTAAEATAQNKP